MDDYPEHLAPEFEESGAVKTPFKQWWARVQPSFPDVPENVAEQWLHRHWGHSPYQWLCSKNYRFTLRDWDSGSLAKIRSGWCNWDNDDCVEHGKYLINVTLEKFDIWLGKYMLKHGEYPEPIIVLDNTDNHLESEGHVPYHRNIPKGLVLVEGHVRFNISLYLSQTKRFKPRCKLWLMERVQVR